MKSNSRLLNALCLLLGASLLLPSCLKDECEATQTYIAFHPVYVQGENFRQPVEAEPARTLSEPGKIYVYGDYLLINEKEKGIHIYNNANPAAPEPIVFLPIPGNVDMAVSNGLLYADSYVDLITIDISNPEAPQFIGRVEEALLKEGFGLQAEGYLVGYEETEETVEVPCSERPDGSFWRGEVFFASSDDALVLQESSSDQQQQQAGIGGSMARFTIAKGHLYVIDNAYLRVFELSNGSNPALANTLQVEWGIETIFPYGDNLFIGAANGMHIFDNSNPLQPQYLSVFRHATACDPVYVDGDVAYVTLRDGQPCETFTNQLDVVDVSVLTDPKLIRSFPMHNPHGLSKYEDALFICENTQGVKVFDASNHETVGQKMIAQIDGFQAYDIITLKDKGLGLVIGANGFFQFDITDPAEPVLISNIIAQ